MQCLRQRHKESSECLSSLDLQPSPNRCQPTKNQLLMKHTRALVAGLHKRESFKWLMAKSGWPIENHVLFFRHALRGLFKRKQRINGGGPDRGVSGMPVKQRYRSEHYLSPRRRWRGPRAHADVVSKRLRSSMCMYSADTSHPSPLRLQKLDLK